MFLLLLLLLLLLAGQMTSWKVQDPSMLLPAEDELASQTYTVLYFLMRLLSYSSAVSFFNTKHLICLRLSVSGWFNFCLYQNSFSDMRQITYFLNTESTTLSFVMLHVWLCNNLANWITTLKLLNCQNPKHWAVNLTLFFTEYKR